MVFLVLVLALVCAWLICQFIRKFGKRFIRKFFKVAIWTTLVISVLYIAGHTLAIAISTYDFAKKYVYHRDVLAARHMLPSNFIPHLKKHGVKGVLRRWHWNNHMSEEQYEAMVKEQEAIAKKQFLDEFHELGFRPRSNGFWSTLFHSLKAKLLYRRAKKKGYL